MNPNKDDLQAIPEPQRSQIARQLDDIAAGKTDSNVGYFVALDNCWLLTYAVPEGKLIINLRTAKTVKERREIKRLVRQLNENIDRHSIAD